MKKINNNRGVICLSWAFFFFAITAVIVAVILSLFEIFSGISETRIAASKDYYKAEYGMRLAQSLLMQNLITSYPDSYNRDLDEDGTDDVSFTIYGPYVVDLKSYNDITSISGQVTLQAVYSINDTLIVSIE